MTLNINIPSEADIDSEEPETSQLVLIPNRVIISVDELPGNLSNFIAIQIVFFSQFGIDVQEVFISQILFTGEDYRGSTERGDHYFGFGRLRR